MQKARFQNVLTVTAVLYALACLAAGGYVLLSGGPVVRGLGGLAGLLFLPAFPLLRWVFRLKKAPLMDAVLLIFLFLAFILGTVLGWYSYIWWFDLAVHCLSGFVACALGLCLFWMVREDKRAPMGRDALAASGFGFFFSQFVAGLWEMLEYLGFLLTGHDSQNVAATGVGDTMEDMLICLAGSLVMTAAVWLHLKGKRRSFLVLPAEEFYRANYGPEGGESRANGADEAAAP